MIVLTDAEKDKFRAWLLQNLETSKGMLEQAKTINCKPIEMKLKMEILAYTEVIKSLSGEVY